MIKKPRSIKLSWGEIVKVGASLNPTNKSISITDRSDEIIIFTEDSEKLRDWLIKYCKWIKKMEEVRE